MCAVIKARLNLRTITSVNKSEEETEQVEAKEEEEKDEERD